MNHGSVPVAGKNSKEKKKELTGECRPGGGRLAGRVPKIRVRPLGAGLTGISLRQARPRAFHEIS